MDMRLLSCLWQARGIRGAEAPPHWHAASPASLQLDAVLRASSAPLRQTLDL